MKKLLNAKYSPFMLMGVMVLSLLLGQLLGTISLVVFFITVFLFVVLIVYRQAKSLKDVSVGRQIDLRAPISGDELLSFLQKGNFEYAELRGMALDADENISLRIGRKKATLVIEPNLLRIQSNMRADNEYLFMLALKAFLYPDKAEDIERERFNALWPKKVKPYLYIGMVLVIIVAILSSAGMRYRINGWIHSKGVSTMTLADYPRQPVGEFLGSYFDQPRWSNYTEQGQQYVAFSGVRPIAGADSQVILTFGLQGTSVYIEDCKINGMSWGTLGGWSIFDAAYENATTVSLPVASEAPPAQTQDSGEADDPVAYDDALAGSEALADFNAMLDAFAGSGYFTSFGNIAGDGYWEWMDTAYEVYGDEAYHVWFFDNAQIGIDVYEGLLASDSDGGWPAGTDTWNLFHVIDRSSDPAFQKQWYGQINGDTIYVDLHTQLLNQPIQVYFTFEVNVSSNTYNVFTCTAEDLNGNVMYLEDSQIDALFNYLASEWQSAPGLSMYFPEYAGAW